MIPTQPREVIKVPPAYEMPIQQAVQARPSVYHQVSYQPTFYDIREPAATPPVYLQSNQQHAYIQTSNMYQPHYTPHIYNYQQEYQQYPTMFNGGSHLMKRTAVARGGNAADYSELMKQSQNELSVSYFGVAFV